jgi:CheY-like chemotaxis protein
LTDQGRSNPYALLGDQPNVVEADPLGFDQIARGLGDLVLASRDSTPFTLGIEGDWGMGKSSLMQRLETRLHAEDDVETVWFNAWTAREGDVLEGLIKSVLERMDPSMLRRAARDERLMSGLRVATRVGARWLRVGDMVDDLWKQMSIDPNARNEMRKLVIGAMEQWRSKGGGKSRGRLLCVFVDDLDRCSPANVFQVFEAIKLYLDAEGLVFVVGYHPAIVTEAILAKQDYGSGVTSRAYLEKIVQISYTISAPDDDQARELVDSYVRSSQTRKLFESSSVRELVIERNARNPRRIKRFINNFILRYGLDPDWSDIGAPVLIRVQILDMYFPDFADLLAERSERDVLDEFLEYVEVRGTLRRGADREDEGSWRKVLEAFEAQKRQPDLKLTDPDLLAQLEQELPESFPALAGDADFVVLVRSLADSDKREQFCDKLARRRRALDADTVAEGASGGGIPHEGLAAEILWIDDNPSNNLGLVNSLTRMGGARVTAARDLDEARGQLTARSFDLLISDIGREGRPDAGFEDLASFRKDGLYNGPAIFYAARITPARRAQAEKLDAQITAAPSELMRMIDQAVARPTMRA